jgi:hypothetical protein
MQRGERPASVRSRQFGYPSPFRGQVRGIQSSLPCFPSMGLSSRRPLPSGGSRRARFPAFSGTTKALRLPARASPVPYGFGSGLHMLPLVRVRRSAPGAVGTASGPGVFGQPVCPFPALRTWSRSGSLRFPGGPSHTFARFADPGRIGGTSPLAVSSMLPPVPTRRRLQRDMISRLNPELWYPLPTLHERRCRHPCKARFRLAGCAFTGRGSNPLDRDERFQVTSVLLSRTYPDASRVGGDVAAPTPHRPGRADFPHPVLHGRDSLATAY